jgi:transposase
MKTIVAIDLGKRKSVFCQMNTNSLKPEYFTIKTRPEKFHDIFAGLDQQNSIVLFEIGAQAGWLADMLRAMQIEFQVANVNHPSWKWKNNPNKCDKEDALRLTLMYRLDQLPTVYIPLKIVRQKRSLVYYRQRLVDRSTQIKNNIRALTTGVAIELPDGKECWTMKHRRQIRQLTLPLAEIDDPCQLWRGQLHAELQLLEALEAQLKEVEAKLNKLNKHNPAVALLQTAQGVGPRTAEALVAVIDDPHRFKSGRQVANYVGFTPRRFQSGDMDRSGRISKRGNPLLRRLLVQASWAALRYDWARQIFKRVCRGSKKRKKTAIVAVARHLLVRCWAMLRDNKPWQYKTVADVVKP